MPIPFQVAKEWEGKTIFFQDEGGFFHAGLAEAVTPTHLRYRPYLNPVQPNQSGEPLSPALLRGDLLPVQMNLGSILRFLQPFPGGTPMQGQGESAGGGTPFGSGFPFNMMGGSQGGSFLHPILGGGFPWWTGQQGMNTGSGLFNNASPFSLFFPLMRFFW